jgi:hypothetical protein
LVWALILFTGGTLEGDDAMVIGIVKVVELVCQGDKQVSDAS